MCLLFLQETKNHVNCLLKWHITLFQQVIFFHPIQLTIFTKY